MFWDCSLQELTHLCPLFVPKGLKTPSNCELVVGGEPQCWAEGRCLLFDDSFLHTAFHEGKHGAEGCSPLLPQFYPSFLPVSWDSSPKTAGAAPPADNLRILWQHSAARGCRVGFAALVPAGGCSALPLLP